MPAETSRPSRNDKRTPKRYEAIFDGYNNLGTYSQAFDEMFDGQGNVRGPYKGIFAELSPSDASDLEARAEALGRAFTDQGITFSLSGQERPFPLDLVPRVISAAEWTRLERGITQRVKARSTISTTSTANRRSCATAHPAPPGHPREHH